MGCDIHMCIEVRSFEKWSAAILSEATYDVRNYILFSWLAGVRNYHEKEIVPLAAPHGLPPDLSAAVRDEFEDLGNEGHSHSWLTAEEVLSARPPEVVGGGGVEGFLEWLAAIVSDQRTMMGTIRGRQNIRLVFAFDN